MWQTIALAWRAAAQEQGAHGCRLTYASSSNGRRDIGHCVIDCQPGRNRAARCIYVEADGLFWGICFEKEQLSYNRSGHGLIDCTIKADDAFLECEK